MSHVISKFYGMTVLMSLDQTDTEPHFEVIYDGKISKFSIAKGKIYEGELIQDGQDILKEWFQTNRMRLEENWKLLTQKKAPKPIPPIL